MPNITPRQLAQTPHGRTLAGMAGAPLEASGVTPDQIAGLTAWYRADTLGLAAGAAVATWPDSSGNGHDLSQATGAKQPTFVLATLAGLPTVQFASAAQQTLASAAFTFNQPATVFIVAKNSVVNGYFTDGLAQNTRVLQPFPDISHLQMYAGVVLNIPTASLSAWSIIHAVFAGTASIAAQNGAEVAGNAGTVAASGIVLSAFINGNIAEAIFYGRALRADERLSIVAYLGTKYGIVTTVS